MPDTAQPITTFTTATKQKAGVAIAVAGSSGSGKTKTALEIATGLAGPTGTIGLIDTEGRRALHYARQYKFDHCDFSASAPFTPERCTQAIAEAHERFDVVVFDSFSDEYEGEGGFLDMGAAESGTGWPKTKARHKGSIVRYIRQKPRFTIFCLRAEEKVKIEKVEGKTVFTPQGWMPICEKRFMYDMTLSLTLSPESPGKPRFDLPHKVMNDFLPLFTEGKHITRAVGEGLRAWALDVDYTPPPPPLSFKWTNLAGKVFPFTSAATWREKVLISVSTISDDHLPAFLAANLAELNGHLVDANDEALAIFAAFAERGVYPVKSGELAAGGAT